LSSQGPTDRELEHYRLVVVGKKPSVVHLAERGAGQVTLYKYDMTQTDSMRSMSQGEWYPVCLNCREVAGR
jgi:hypothetical protein